MIDSVEICAEYLFLSESDVFAVSTEIQPGGLLVFSGVHKTQANLVYIPWI